MGYLKGFDGFEFGDAPSMLFYLLGCPCLCGLFVGCWDGFVRCGVGCVLLRRNPSYAGG
jgi:hypothetical protein